MIRGVGLIHKLDQIGSIVVTQFNGTPVLVRDLGRTTLEHQEREGILGKDNNPDTIEGIVLMLKYQNPSETLQRHPRQGEAELNRTLATDGVKIVAYIDRDNLVRATVRKVGQTILEGIVLVFLILILFSAARAARWSSRSRFRSPWWRYFRCSISPMCRRICCRWAR